MRTKEPLSVCLGPGILEQIFDGIQRPLETIARTSESVFIPKGADVPTLNFDKQWLFEPNKSVKEGQIITGGDVLGSCFENSLFDEHRILVPPKIKGKLTWIAPHGNYTIQETIATVEYDNKTHKISMCHWWPVR